MVTQNTTCYVKRNLDHTLRYIGPVLVAVHKTIASARLINQNSLVVCCRFIHNNRCSTTHISSALSNNLDGVFLAHIVLQTATLAVRAAADTLIEDLVCGNHGASA